MKKFFAILLTVCMISALLVMPASAASIFEASKYLDLDASNIIYHDVAATATPVGEYMEISAYPIANIFDGDTTTTAAISFWGQSYKQGGATKQELKDIFLTGELVIDLGAQYQVEALEFIAPTAAQAAAINAAYPSAIALNHNESWWAGGVSFYTENPVENADATATAATMLTGKVNNGVTPPAGSYRYIKFTGRYYNQGAGFINELRVKVPDNSGADEYGCRYADFGQTTAEYADTTYPMSNLFDGDPNTHALLALRNASNCNYSIRVVDLGEEKNIESLKLTVPSDYTALLTAIGIGNKNGNYCDIYGYQNEPTFTKGLAPSSNPPLSQDNSGILLAGGALSNREVAVDTDTPIRYLAFFTTMAGYPGMLSELVIVEDDREGSVSFKTTAAAGTVDATTYEMVSTSTGDWTIVGEIPEYPISNIFDDDADSIGWLINRDDINGSHRASDIVIDLGKDTEISAIDWTWPTEAEAEAVLTATGYTAVGGSANQYPNAVNSYFGQGCGVYGVSADGTVSNKLTQYGNMGPEDYRKVLVNLEGNAYRYIKISTGHNFTVMLKDFSIIDKDGNELIGATKDVVRFYVAPTLTSKYYDTEEFGMYIVPFALFEDEGDAETSGVQMKMEGKIVTGQNYAADMADIPAEAADVPMVVVPFVKLGGDYFYGNASSQFTLNGLK